ncbi:hypothetical protein ACFL0Z_01125 [Patescibacteria group bacterium]
MLVFRENLTNINLLTGLMVIGAVVVFGLLPLTSQAVDSYQLDLDLTGGEAAAVAELNEKLGPEGEGWKWRYGYFTTEGYLLTSRSALLLNLGDDFPIEYVDVSFEASGIDNEIDSLEGEAHKDGYLFNIWSTNPGWRDPCNPDGTVDMEIEASIWGFGLKKWPSMPNPDEGYHMYSNSILMQGTGMSNGTAVPGAGIGDRFDWEAQTGFYKIETTLHAGQAEPSFLAVDKPNGVPVFHSPGGVPYGPLSLEDKDGIVATIGGETAWNSGTVSPTYGGVTIKNVHIEAGHEYIPDDRAIWLTGCLVLEPGGEDVDDPDNPYDTCACHGIPDVAEIPCEDPVNRGDKRKLSYLDPFPFGFNGMTMDWKWKLEDIMKEFGTKNEQMSPMPDLTIEFAPPSPQTGDVGTAMAATMNFRTRMQKLYFGWCMIIDDLVYPMNSIVAGGQNLPDLTEPDLSWDDLGCCQPITRIPEVDVDGDGMDDNWEEAKFVGREGTNYTDIYDVSPTADPDSDGYYASTYVNEKDELLSVTPYLIAANADNSEFSTGGSDAQLTNLEEYILDTDPLNGDTDGDGYGDEMDFIGVGQIQMQFRVDKDPGPEGFYDISVAALGINQLKKPAFIGAKQRYFVGDNGNLKIAMTASKAVMTFNDNLPIDIEVNVIGSTESSEDLFYEWFFNGESACNGTDSDIAELCDEGEMGGVGKRRVTLGNGGISFFDLPESGANDTEYTISVRAVSPSSRGEDQFELSFPMALPVNLVTEDCAGQTENIDVLTAGSMEPLLICISEIAELAAYDPTNLNFIWTKDGYSDEQQSGSGKTEYALLPTKPAGEQHIVGVIVKNSAEARELVNAQRIFYIAGPSVKIIEPAVLASDPGNEDRTRYASFNAGDNVFLEAEISNFNTESGYRITWLVNGQEIETKEMTETISVSGWRIPEEAEKGDTFPVQVMISSLDRNNPAQMSDGITLVVGTPPSELGVANPMLEGLAAVFSKVPKAFQEIMKYAAILASVFFALVFLYPKVARFLDK